MVCVGHDSLFAAVIQAGSALCLPLPAGGAAAGACTAAIGESAASSIGSPALGPSRENTDTLCDFPVRNRPMCCTASFLQALA